MKKTNNVFSKRFVISASLALFLVAICGVWYSIVNSTCLETPSLTNAYADDPEPEITHNEDDLTITGDNLEKFKDYYFQQTKEQDGGQHYILYITTTKPVTIKNKDINNLNDTQIIIANKIYYDQEDGRYPLTAKGTADVTLDGVNIAATYSYYSGTAHICSPILIGGNYGDATVNVNLHIKQGSVNHLYGVNAGERAVIDKPMGKEAGTLRIDGTGELHIDGKGTACIGGKSDSWNQSNYLSNIYFDHPNLWLSDKSINGTLDESLIGFHSYSTDADKVNTQGLYNITFDGGTYHMQPQFPQICIGAPLQFSYGQATFIDPDGNETSGYVSFADFSGNQGVIEGCTIKDNAYFDSEFSEYRQVKQDVTLITEPIQNLTSGAGWTIESGFLKNHVSEYELKWEPLSWTTGWDLKGFKLKDDQSGAYNEYKILGNQVTLGESTTIEKGNLDIAESGSLSVPAGKNISIGAGGTITNYGTLTGVDNVACTDDGKVLSAVTFDASPGRIPAQDDATNATDTNLTDNLGEAATSQVYKVIVKDATGAVNCVLPPDPTGAVDDYGYNLALDGWYTQADAQGEALLSTKPMNVNNHTAFAHLVNASMTYNVDFYTQKPEDDTYELAKSVTMPDAAPTNTNVSVSAENFDGTELDDGDFLGTQYQFDEANNQNKTSGYVGAIQADDSHLKLYYNLAPVTLTYAFAGDVPTDESGAPIAAPDAVQTAYKKTVTLADAPAAVEGYSVTGWQIDGADVEANELTMTAEDVTLTATWTKKPVDPPTPDPKPDPEPDPPAPDPKPDPEPEPQPKPEPSPVTPNDTEDDPTIAEPEIIPTQISSELASTGDFEGYIKILVECFAIASFACAGLVIRALRKKL